MMTKWYEIICDGCGWAQRFQGSARTAENQFRDYGGIITKDKKHYCEKDCRKKSKK